MTRSEAERMTKGNNEARLSASRRILMNKACPEHRETAYKGGCLLWMRWHSLPRFVGVTSKSVVYHIADYVDAAAIGGQLMSLSRCTGQAPGRSHQPRVVKVRSQQKS